EDPGATRGAFGPAGLPRARLPRFPRHGWRGGVPRHHRRPGERDPQAPFFGRGFAFFALTAGAFAAAAARFAKSSSSSVVTARSMDPFMALRRNPSVTVR